MMRISELHVYGLLYKNEYVIRLNRADHITLLHGPNACGKTLILTFLSALSNKDFETIRQIPFRIFCIFFDNSTELRIFSTFRQLANWYPHTPAYESILPLGDLYATDESPNLYFDLIQPDGQHLIYSLGPSGFSPLVPSEPVDRREIERLKRQIRSEESDISALVREPSISTRSISLLELATRARGSTREVEYRIDALPSALEDLLSSVSTYLLSTDRLKVIHCERSISTDPVRESVELLIRDLGRWIIELEHRVKIQNQIFHAKFEDLLFHRSKSFDEKAAPTIQESCDRLEDLGGWWNEHHFYGWTLPLQANPAADPLFSDLVSDFEARLEWYAVGPAGERIVLDMLVSHIADVTNTIKSFAERLCFLLDLLQQMTEKTFIIDSMVDQEDGVIIYDGKASTDSIPLHSLSSGEKQLIVMVGAMLFEAPENSLVLIDEPELSLHVYWQRQFLKIIERIIELNPIDVLIATHSPQIVHDRRDLAIGLGAVE